MKGGVWSFGSLSESEFNVRIPLKILDGTNQLIIKQTRRDIFEPHIFFGPIDFKIDNDDHYTYAVFNKYLHPISLSENKFIVLGIAVFALIKSINHYADTTGYF